MKKLFVFMLVIFVIFNMTSCSSIRMVSDLIGNTVPNVIANYTKEAILPDEKISEDPQPNDPNTNQNTDTSNSNTQKNDLPAPSFQPNDNDLDYTKLINEITTTTIKACVNITTAEFNTITATIPLKSSVGSGVIFKAYAKNDDIYHYYVLTNYHVVELSENYPYYKYTITDCQGNEYRASVPSWIKNETKKQLCKEHDLAILEFETQNQLNVIAMDTENPAINQTVISIGQPKGQQNAITFGIVEGYTEITIKDDFNPDFDVIVHTTPIDHGNSGGAILNTDLKLAGINFAGSWNDDGTFVYGYGIPIKTVRKFLSDFEISQ